MSTATLSVSNTKRRDTFYISSSQDLTAHSGRLVLTIASLDVAVSDLPPAAKLDPRARYYGPKYQWQNDSVPLFGAVNTPTPGGYGRLGRLAIRHPTSKLSGHKDYQQKQLIVAVNKGKPDGNAFARGATSTDLACLVLAKLPRRPCDDLVTATVTYTVGWTQMGVV